jgi:hypothetical protein
MDQKEKWATVGTAMGSAIKAETTGKDGEKATPTIADMDLVQSIINEWSALPQKSAQQIIEKYGPPNEAIPSRLIWYNNTPWKRTIVYRDEFPHNFPQPHSDTIEQVIDYQVPPEKLTELSKFDGSLIVERTKGELYARCDMEAANFIAINVMHDMIARNLTAEEAKERLSEQASAYLMNRHAPYAEGFLFDLPKGDTTDIDHVTIAGPMMHQAVEKVKDVMRSDER